MKAMDYLSSARANVRQQIYLRKRPAISLAKLFLCVIVSIFLARRFLMSSDNRSGSTFGRAGTIHLPSAQPSLP